MKNWDEHRTDDTAHLGVVILWRVIPMLNILLVAPSLHQSSAQPHYILLTV